MRIAIDIFVFLLVISFLYIFGPVLKVESKYTLDKALNIKYSVDTEEEGTFEKPLLIPDLDFSIVIPKIGASSKIIQGVNVKNKIEFLKELKLGVVMASDSALPGQPGNVSLFAHSTDNKSVTRYNSVFYLLGKLKPGNIISIYYQGQEIKYQVGEVKILNPLATYSANNIEALNTLTIQTNHPMGLGFKKLIVLAKEQFSD